MFACDLSTFKNFLFISSHSDLFVSALLALFLISSSPLLFLKNFFLDSLKVKVLKQDQILMRKLKELKYELF